MQNIDKHISKSALIKTDKWTGYNPLTKEFDLKQIKIRKSNDFGGLHGFRTITPIKIKHFKSCFLQVTKIKVVSLCIFSSLIILLGTI